LALISYLTRSLFSLIHFRSINFFKFIFLRLAPIDKPDMKRAVYKFVKIENLPYEDDWGMVVIKLRFAHKLVNVDEFPTLYYDLSSLDFR
jgi:hypothetical protein